MQAVKAAPKHRAASAPMPCHAKAGQRSPRAALSVHCATVHAQRKRTDDDDSPPWLYPTATPGGPERERNRAVGVRTRRAPPPKGRTHSVSHCARPHSATRRCSLAVAAKRKLGGNQAPLQRVVGAFVHKRREDGSEGLTTLHTTPLPSPHTELFHRSRTHSLSLPVFTSPESSRALAAMAAAPLLLLLLLAMFTGSSGELRICTLLCP
jgi:hypothetical protein